MSEPEAPDWAVVFGSVCVLVGFELLLAIVGIAVLGLPTVWVVLGLFAGLLVCAGALVLQEAAKGSQRR